MFSNQKQAYVLGNFLQLLLKKYEESLKWFLNYHFVSDFSFSKKSFFLISYVCQKYYQNIFFNLYQNIKWLYLKTFPIKTLIIKVLQIPKEI